MNFLQLCQRARIEFGATGTDLSPVTVVNQTGEMRRIVNWINAAWMDIQTAHQDWQWLRTSCNFPTVAGQALYAPTTDIGLTDFGMWARDAFRCYDTAAGIKSEMFLGYLDYENWRDSYQYGAFRSVQTRPMVITVSPAKELGLGPVPAAGYTILGDYFKAPSEMVADADIPALPAQYHMAIVYRAMMFYGRFEAAGEVYQAGELEFTKMMRRMTADRMPEIRMGGTLA